MRLYLFTQYYPSTFKPYFDTQFAQLVEDGHEITIFAHGRQGQVVNEKVEQYDLSSRVRRYPTRLRHLPNTLGGSLRAAMASPLVSADRIGAARIIPEPRVRFTHQVRSVGLPAVAPDLCLIHDLTTATWFPWLREVYPKAAVVMYYHGGENAAAHTLKEDAVARAFAGVDVVFTNTEFSAAHAVSRGCPRERVIVLPVGFVIDDYRPAEVREYRPDGVLRVASAGRMSEEKGHLFALEAVRRLVQSDMVDLRYTLIGGGHMRPVLERFVDEHSLRPHVEFAGTVSTDELIRRLGETDLVLLPSLHLGNWLENQACIVQEAMLMKALVISTATGGVPESTAPELRQFLIPPEDADAIADAVLAVSALSQSEMAAMGEAGRTFAVGKYDIRTLNRELLGTAVQRRDAGRDDARRSNIADVRAPQ